MNAPTAIRISPSECTSPVVWWLDCSAVTVECQLGVECGRQRFWRLEQMRWRQGQLVRVEHRQCDKLAIALLNSPERDPNHFRRTAVSRREHRLDLAAKDAAEKERDRRIAEAEADYQAEVDRLIAAIHLGPRIRAL